MSQAERIVVAHPSYPAQRHEVDVWVIQAPGQVIRFAAGEMSNLAWAFFLPDHPEANDTSAYRQYERIAA